MLVDILLLVSGNLLRGPASCLASHSRRTVSAPTAAPTSTREHSEPISKAAEPSAASSELATQQQTSTSAQSDKSNTALVLGVVVVVGALLAGVWWHQNRNKKQH